MRSRNGFIYHTIKSCNTIEQVNVCINWITLVDDIYYWAKSIRRKIRELNV